MQKDVRTIEVPTATFCFQHLSDSVRQELRSFGLQREGQTDNFFGSPNPADIASILRHGPIDRKIPPGHINADGYLAYIYALKGYQIYSTAMGIARKTSPSYTTHASTSYDLSEELKDNLAYISKSGSIEEMVPVNIGSTNLKLEQMIFNDEVRAFATPFDNTKSFPGEFVDIGRLTDLGDEQGIFFPYFHGMLLPDKSLLVHVFSRLFFQMMGKDFESASRLWMKIRPGLRNISYSDAGRALSHLYAGIDISSKTGSKITAVVQSGRYHGFVLQGDVKIHLYGQLYEPVDSLKLFQEIGLVNRHDENLRKIISEIHSITDMDGVQKYHLTMGSVNTSRRLANTIYGIDEVDMTPERKKVLSEFLENLSFGDKYAPLTEASVLAAAAYIQSGDLNALSQFPAYIGTNYVFNSSRVAIALGIFGPRAPSFNFVTKGQTFVFPGESVRGDPNLQVKDGKRVLRYIPFASEPVRLAVAQWESAFNNGQFTIPFARKNRDEFTNNTSVQFHVGGEVGFNTLYGILKDRANLVRSMRKEGKRKREDSRAVDADGEARKKQKVDYAELEI